MSERVVVKATDVAAWLQRNINEGQWQPNDRLPSERVISEQLQTSRVTAREALRMLETRGLIYRSNRRGWFVTPARINYDPSRPAFFMQYVADQGFTPFSHQLSKKRIVANESLAQLPGITEGELLVELVRLRGADNRPVYVETILLPEQRLPGIFEHDLERSVTSVLQREYHNPSVTVEMDMIASSLEQDDAELLQAPVGYTSFEIRRVSLDAEGRLVEYDIERWRHDALNLKVALELPG